MNVILPTTYVRPRDIVEPLFYLAGPIRGGGDWQYQGYQELASRLPQFTVAIPSRYESGHPLHSQQLSGLAGIFERQTLWERNYMESAAVSGCLIFWLPNESKAAPREDGHYGRDTLGELGEWRGRLMSNNRSATLSVVIGAESEFPGLSQIITNYVAGLGGFHFYDTLSATIEAAIAQAKKKSS